MSSSIVASFFDPDPPADLEETRLFWAALGVRRDDTIMNELVCVSPRWDRELQMLRVAGALQNEGSYHARLRGILLWAFHWRSWSDTRWQKMFHSSRLILRSKAVGVDYLVKMVQKTIGSSNGRQHINAYTRFGSHQTDLVFAVSAVSLAPLSIFMEAPLRDDRFFAASCRPGEACLGRR